MYDFAPPDGCSPEERYALLNEAVAAITHGEDDAIANMANIAALLGEFIPDTNWVGFYRVIGEGDSRELVLGPFVGRPACIRIPFGVGVCGAAAQSGAAQLVEDVHAFPGHIACDANSRSELVVPVLRAGQNGDEVVAVIDLDSPSPARFGPADQAGVEALAALLSDRI